MTGCGLRNIIQPVNFANAKTLIEEGIITGTVRARIKNRINELLENNRLTISDRVLQLTNAIETFNPEPEIKPSEPPELPIEIRRALGKKEFIVINTLLSHFGHQVTYTDLMQAVDDKSINADIDHDKKVPNRLAALVCIARKKIRGWGTIHFKRGHGYWLEISGQTTSPNRLPKR